MDGSNHSWPEEERQRLEELYALELLDTAPEESFDRITRLVAELFAVPVCLITLITEDRQWFKSCVGLSGELAETRSTSRDVSFCQFVVKARKPVVAEDATLDPRFQANPYVQGDKGIRFYAGVPLQTKTGNVLGTLCILDSKPRSMSPGELERLAELGRWVMSEIELRRDLRLKERLTGELLMEKRRRLEQTSLIRSSFESVYEGRLLCNREGRLLMFNQKQFELFMIHPKLYSHIWGYWQRVQQFCQAEWPMLTQKLKQLLSGELEQFKERFAARLPGEEWRYFEMSGQRIGRQDFAEPEEEVPRGAADADEREPRWHICFRDRTDEALSEQVKNEFISVISHELRTPLTSILGFVEILIDRNPAEEKRIKYLTTIHREAGRLTHLLNDLLDLQKMESGKQQYWFDRIELSKLVGEVLDSYHGESHGFHVRMPEQPLYIFADADRMKQALHNLISNAIKYSPGAAYVDLDVTEQEGMAVIRIRDYGLGIPEEARGKLFTKFYRVDNSDRRKIGGTGLGLAIVKEIMNAHGGEVEYEPAPDTGTVFILRLETLPD